MSKDLIQIEEQTLAHAFATGEGITEMLEKAEMAVSILGEGADTSTAAGRKAIASNAYKVSRLASKVDKAAVASIAEAQLRVNSTNERRRFVRERLKTLKTDARAPLDEWEKAEAERVAAIRGQLKAIENIGVISDMGKLRTVDQLKAQLTALNDIPILSDWFEEYFDEAQKLAATTETTIINGINAAARAEAADKAAEQQRKDAEEAQHKAAALQAELDKERAEKEAISKALLEAEGEKRAAASRVVREKEIAEEAAQAARDKLIAEQEAIKSKELAEAQWRAEEQRKKEAAEEAKRQDAAHRNRVEMEATRDFAETVGADSADSIMKAIKAGNIRHVTLEY